jgi:hypothetical protein
LARWGRNRKGTIETQGRWEFSPKRLCVPHVFVVNE